MPSHIVMLPWFPWGHLRPSIGLAVTLARKFEDLTISFAIDADFVDKSKDEMLKLCLNKDEEQSLLPRIRVLGIGRQGPSAAIGDPAALMRVDARDLQVPPPPQVAHVLALLGPVMRDEAFEDENGVQWEPVGIVPKLVITDIMQTRIVLPIKEQFGISIWLVWVATAVSYTRFLGPNSYGGKFRGWREEVFSIFEDEKQRAGRTFNEVCKSSWEVSTRIPKDEIIRMRGVPPFYEWETVPQAFFSPIAWDLHTGHEALCAAADGAFVPCVPELEPEALPAAMEWMTAENRTLIPIGPTGPLGPLAVAASGGAQDPCLTFLDEALKKYGAHTALYISFGSIFFPGPVALNCLIDAILALERLIPFIVTTAGAIAPVPEDVLAKIKASGCGMVVSWAPQQAVLAHPATGWIISHCGGGGMYEALSQGVPVICWPFGADQQLNASFIVDVLDAGYEFLQVRTGVALCKAYRGGPDGTQILGTETAIREEMDAVLKGAQGAEGEKKRANAARAQRAIVEFVTPGSTGGVYDQLEQLRPYLTQK